MQYSNGVYIQNIVLVSRYRKINVIYNKFNRDNDTCIESIDKIIALRTKKADSYQIKSVGRQNRIYGK